MCGVSHKQRHLGEALGHPEVILGKLALEVAVGHEVAEDRVLAGKELDEMAEPARVKAKIDVQPHGDGSVLLQERQTHKKSATSDYL